MKTSGKELNLFEEFQRKKESLRELIAKARDFGWIDDDRVTAMNDKLDNDVLTVGVIGQMKCGKSTFLNSFVFEDTILPAATTPMTAALSLSLLMEQRRRSLQSFIRQMSGPSRQCRQAGLWKRRKGTLWRNPK